MGLAASKRRRSAASREGGTRGTPIIVYRPHHWQTAVRSAPAATAARLIATNPSLAAPLANLGGPGWCHYRNLAAVSDRPTAGRVF